MIYPAIFFVIAGSFHFIFPENYLKIMPPYIPYPIAMIYISGFFEILFGLGLIFDKTRQISALGITLLLIAVFPANVHMALHASDFPMFPAWVYWGRLPLQGLFILWVNKK